MKTLDGYSLSERNLQHWKAGASLAEKLKDSYLHRRLFFFNIKY
jgi:hypothetical protein